MGDLSGIGASLFGGRWNPKGMRVLYTAESRSLAALEFYAGRGRAGTLIGLSLAIIAIPDTVSISRLTVADLPPGWKSYPAPVELAELGAQWIESAETLVLSVPSALIPQEHNYLINPAHPEMAQVRVDQIEEYSYDQRFLS